MLDRVVEMSETELTAIKNVTINEPFFQGHYPGNPVMPGVLQIEAMAQAAGILLLRRADKDGKTALFMSCDKVKWRKPRAPRRPAAHQGQDDEGARHGRVRRGRMHGQRPGGVLRRTDVRRRRQHRDGVTHGAADPSHRDR
ncbi:MAG: hypothetical protein WDM96_01775 [Lacunisphaera sp.]